MNESCVGGYSIRFAIQKLAVKFGIMRVKDGAAKLVID